MRHILSFTEARAKLSTLLDRVEAGDEIVITRHNQPVARLVPVWHHNRTRAKAMEAAKKAFSVTHGANRNQSRS